MVSTRFGDNGVAIEPIEVSAYDANRLMGQVDWHLYLEQNDDCDC